jgi:hypothetical protein
MSIKNKRISRVAVVLTALVVVFCFTSAVAAQNTGGVKGKVRTVRGSGVAGATVTARQKGVDVKSVKADAKGTFVLDGLQAGRYNLIFDAPGYSSGVLYNVEIEKKKVADLSERLILSADQGTQVIVKGSVFFKEGTSVAGAKVEIERVNADGSTKRLGTGYTSESGEFTWRQPQGAAKLRVTATSKGVSSSKIVEVDEPAIYRFAITLELSRSEK